MGTYHRDCQAPIKHCTKHMTGIKKGVRADNHGYQNIKDVISVNKSQITNFFEKKLEKTN
jgi:hypothetical protein